MKALIGLSLLIGTLSAFANQTDNKGLTRETPWDNWKCEIAVETEEKLFLTRESLNPRIQ